MANYNRFESNLEVIVVDRNGNKTGEVRSIANAPITALLPNEKVVMINWLYDNAPKPVAETISKVVKFEGVEYHGCYGWGSSAKRGYSIGFERDVVPLLGGKFSEDGQRIQRALLANGINGAAKGEFRVKFVKAGTIIPGAGPVEDGFGYIARKCADVVDNSADKIVLGDARDAYHFWQRVPWTEEVAAESKPLIDEALIDLAEGGFNFRLNSTMEARKRFVEVEPKMAQHPWIANSLARSSAETAARTAMTVKTNSSVKIAVPSIVAAVAMEGKHIGTRYPMDAWDSAKAFDAGEEVHDEAERIAKMEVVQYTLSSVADDDGNGMFCKGCVGIVDDLGEYDMILCEEDRKMARHQYAVTTVYGVFVATAWYAAGSALGINAAYWKKQGGDFDGDYIIVTNCSDRPALWNAVNAYPEQMTLKLTKTHTEITKKDTRAEMIVKSMANIVGMATNLMAATFAFADRELVAKRMGYISVQAMDNKLNFWIKCGTDLFKTNLDAADIEKQMMQFQANFSRQFGKLPPWCNWPNEWAFRHGVPEWYRAEMGKDKDDPVVKNSIPAHFDGTIAQILRITLSNVQAIVNTPIESRPLKEFDGWAPMVGPEIAKQAAEIQARFNVRTQSTNWEWDESVASFKAWLLNEIDEWMKTEKIDRQTAAYAMWHAAHSTRSIYAGASSVFMVFPEECFEIVSKKPGLDKDRLVVGVVLTGDTLHQDTLGEVDAKVVEFVEIKSGRKIVRKALEVLKFQFNFAPDQPVPTEGKYRVMLKRRSAKSFFAYCIPA